MDHAGTPVMLLRHSHGKMRRDGFRAAWMQPDFAVDERGRLHSAPGLVDVVVWRGQACIRGPCRNRGDHRQCVRNCKTPDRLRLQDKANFVRSPLGLQEVVCTLFFVARSRPTSRARRRFFPFSHCYQYAERRQGAVAAPEYANSSYVWIDVLRRRSRSLHKSNCCGWRSVTSIAARSAQRDLLTYLFRVGQTCSTPSSLALLRARLRRLAGLTGCRLLMPGKARWER